MADVWMCHVCNKRPAISREHVPPQSTSNSGAVDVVFIDGTNAGEGIRHRGMTSSNGFWIYALCRECNNTIGSRYGTAYTDFVAQVSNASGLVDPGGRAFVSLQSIFPLRVIKQMYSMFLCTMPQQPMPVGHGIREFVRQRDALLPNDAPFVYLYMNTSDRGRIVPWCAISELFTQRQTIALSEVSWPPIGLIFCEQPDERFGSMENITNWGRYKYKEALDISLQLPQLRVNTDHPLAFGSLTEIDTWRTSCGVIWAVAEADDPSRQTSVSVVWKRSNR